MGPVGSVYWVRSMKGIPRTAVQLRMVSFKQHLMASIGVISFSTNTPQQKPATFPSWGIPGNDCPPYQWSMIGFVQCRTKNDSQTVLWLGISYRLAACGVYSTVFYVFFTAPKISKNPMIPLVLPQKSNDFSFFLSKTIPFSNGLSSWLSEHGWVFPISPRISREIPQRYQPRPSDNSNSSKTSKSM